MGTAMTNARSLFTNRHPLYLIQPGSASENEADQGEANSQPRCTKEPEERCRLCRFFASFENEKKSSQTERNDDKRRRAHRKGRDDMVRENRSVAAPSTIPVRQWPSTAAKSDFHPSHGHAVRQEAEENLSHDLYAYLDQELDHPSLSGGIFCDRWKESSFPRGNHRLQIRAIAWGREITDVAIEVS